MKYYKNGNIVNSPSIPNVSNPSHETILNNGWKECVEERPYYDTQDQKLIVDRIDTNGTPVRRIWKAVYEDDPVEEEITPERRKTISSDRRVMDRDVYYSIDTSSSAVTVTIGYLKYEDGVVFHFKNIGDGTNDAIIKTESQFATIEGSNEVQVTSGNNIDAVYNKETSNFEVF